MSIDRGEFATWLNNPVTKSIISMLRERSDYFQNLILDGMPGAQESKLILAMGEAIGRINAYNELIDIHFEDTQEFREDENE